MNSNLLESSLLHHGGFLLDQLRAEQQITVDHQALSYVTNVLPHSDVPRDECDRRLVKFIAKKADLLFGIDTNVAQWRPGSDINRTRYCAVLPPIEYFMEVSRTSKRQHFFECLDRGDVVIGTVTALNDAGLTVALLAVDVGMARDIDQLKITAFCPLREIPKAHAHEDALAPFSIKDRIRAVVIGILDEKITLSLQPRALPANCNMPLGVITDEDLPAYFRALESADSRSYGNLLRDAPEFRNPLDVSNMAVLFGLGDASQRPSLMRGLHRVTYNEADYADSLRKEQSRKMAMRRVAEGVDHFKNDRLPEAMQMLNSALQIDSDNVEALVARGALYANSESYQRALEDFDAALAVNPDHANARKYACDTLLALARSLLDKGDVDMAISRVYRASLMQPNNSEIVQLLSEIQCRKEAEMADEEVMNGSSGDGDGTTVTISHAKESLMKSIQKDDLGRSSDDSPKKVTTRKRTRTESSLKSSSHKPSRQASKVLKRRKRSSSASSSSSSSSCTSSTSSSSSSTSSSSSSSSSSSDGKSPADVAWVPAPVAEDRRSLSQLVGCAKVGAHRGYDVTLVNPERRQSGCDMNANGTFGPSLPPDSSNVDGSDSVKDKSADDDASPWRHESSGKKRKDRKNRSSSSSSSSSDQTRKSHVRRSSSSSSDSSCHTINRKKRNSSSDSSDLHGKSARKKQASPIKKVDANKLEKTVHSRLHSEDSKGHVVKQKDVRRPSHHSKSSLSNSSDCERIERKRDLSFSDKKSSTKNLFAQRRLSDGRSAKFDQHHGSFGIAETVDKTLSQWSAKKDRMKHWSDRGSHFQRTSNPRDKVDSRRSASDKMPVKRERQMSSNQKPTSGNKQSASSSSDDDDRSAKKSVQPKADRPTETLHQSDSVKPDSGKLDKTKLPVNSDEKPKETLEDLEMFLKQLKANKQKK